VKKLIIPLALPALLACGVSTPIGPEDGRFGTPGQEFQENVDPENPGEAPTFVAGDLELSNGNMEGEIGAVRGFGDHEVVGLEGWSESTYASVFTTALGDNGAGMSIVEVSGGFFHPDLAPGTTRTYESTDYPAAGEAFVYVIGCSGDTVGDWDFDREADSTTISVEENADDPQILDIQYTARFSNWDNTERSVIGGSFSLQKRLP
jgi:hypothetical protein